jgi:hypothetical protein
MKIAFIILAHHNHNHLKRLIGQVHNERVSIYLHIDRGVSDRTFRTMQKQLAEFDDLAWLPRCYSHWGSWGLVNASLSGLRQAQQADCDYAILLSGQDYPIKPLSHLLNFLEENNGISFLQYHRLPSDQWPPDGTSRYTRWHFNLGWKDSCVRTLSNRALNRVFNAAFPHRTLPDELVPYGGWQWWCLHRNCVDYVLDFAASQHRAVQFFKRVRIPDEMFFHTVLMNSSLNSCVQNRLLTYTDWEGPPYPRILTRDDFESLKASNFFFARKFDAEVDTVILDRIDRELLQQ